MLKCPFCNAINEEGALFCEQCKSDLSAVPSSEPTREVPIAMVEDTIPVAEAVPVEEVPVAEAVAVEETVPMAEEVAEEVVPAPLPALTMPVEPMPVEAAVAELPAAPAAAAAAVSAPPIAAVAAAPAAPAAAPAPSTSVPAGSQPKLIVIRGQKVNVEFPIYGDLNFIGRADDKPVDIDLEDQEPPDRVWSSRQHAVIHFDEAASNLTIEDLGSANGTYVNRARLNPGQKKQIFVNDVVQIGNVHLKLKV